MKTANIVSLESNKALAVTHQQIVSAVQALCDTAPILDGAKKTVDAAKKTISAAVEQNCRDENGALRDAITLCELFEVPRSVSRLAMMQALMRGDGGIAPTDWHGAFLGTREGSLATNADKTAAYNAIAVARSRIAAQDKKAAEAAEAEEKTRMAEQVQRDVAAIVQTVCSSGFDAPEVLEAARAAAGDALLSGGGIAAAKAAAEGAANEQSRRIEAARNEAAAQKRALETAEANAALVLTLREELAAVRADLAAAEAARDAAAARVAELEAAGSAPQGKRGK
jgi:hypothetical protein